MAILRYWRNAGWTEDGCRMGAMRITSLSPQDVKTQNSQFFWRSTVTGRKTCSYKIHCSASLDCNPKKTNLKKGPDKTSSFWPKRTKELFKKHRWKGFSSLVQTSKTYHFLKLAPFRSPLTGLIDFGMAGKLLTSATRRCSPFLDSVPRLWLNPKKSLIACWAPTAATFVQSSPSWVQLTAGHNCRNRHFDRPSLVSLVCRSVCTRKIELYLLWAACFRGVLPWLQRTTVKSAGFSCTGTISRVIVKVTSSSNLEKYACAANLRVDKLADFDDGVFFERSTNSSDSAL